MTEQLCNEISCSIDCTLDKVNIEGFALLPEQATIADVKEFQQLIESNVRESYDAMFSKYAKTE